MLRLVEVIWAPNFAENLLVRQDLAGVLDEQPQEGIFRRGEFNFSPLDFDHAGREIHFQPPGAENGGIRRGLAVSHGHSQARKQLAGAEWFGQRNRRLHCPRP